MRLSDISIKKAKPADKSYRLYDEKGMYLEVAPSRWQAVSAQVSV